MCGCFQYNEFKIIKIIDRYLKINCFSFYFINGENFNKSYLMNLMCFGILLGLVLFMNMLKKLVFFMVSSWILF